MRLRLESGGMWRDVAGSSSGGGEKGGEMGVIYCKKRCKGRLRWRAGCAMGGWGAGGHFALNGALVLALPGLGAVILRPSACGVYFHY